MASAFYRHLIRILTEAGYRYHRPGKGSHEIWRHEESGKQVVVPHNLKSKHTANGILKFIGIDYRF